MEISVVKGYHASVSSGLTIESLDVNRLIGAPYGGHGLYITSKKEFINGPRLYNVEAKGLSLNLLDKKDCDYFMRRRNEFKIKNGLTKMYDEDMINFFDFLAQPGESQIIIMNSKTTVIKDLECITKLSLI